MAPGDNSFKGNLLSIEGRKTMSTTKHVPVLLREVLDYLGQENYSDYLDCTLGGGGHSEAILGQRESIKVTALDRDSDAIERTRERLSTFKEKVNILNLPFSKVGEEFEENSFDAVLADLGMSTDQLYSGRGFSFQDEEALDMRMDSSEELTASEIVNNWDESQITRALSKGGVGNTAKRFAKAIVKSRPIESSKQLASVISQATPAKLAATKSSHPATVVFQALRIAVNNELAEIEALLDALPKVVRPGGRAAIICFHSLEDKFVAKRMRSWEGEKGPANWPGASERPGIGKLLTRKAVTPSESEVAANPASRSALLRVFEFSNI